MEKKILQFSVTSKDGFDVILKEKSEEGSIEKYTFELLWNNDDIDDNTEFCFMWLQRMVGAMYFWSPGTRFKRYIEPGWAQYNRSMISVQAPVFSYYDDANNNVMTIAVDECKKLTYYKGGVREHTGELRCYFRIPVKQYTNRTSAIFTLRIDKRHIPLQSALDDVRGWWENDCGMKPAYVPTSAKDPLYSFWYSFHRDINAKAVEDECARAKSLGFDICIVDDGWQCSDIHAGYKYCGDWKPAPDKFPDMKAHVDAVHKMGMKYMLWYSVPFLGCESEAYERFKDKVLRMSNIEGNIGLFDPRYKEVRDHLISIFKNAIIEWGLDGLKLDFIDQWNNDKANAPYDPKMDIPAVSDAVDHFMISLMNELKSIKPDILLEFRQGYTGPNMRKYGNMFRVGDCPYDHASNRLGVFDLRMLMGESAVHSDMLMWNKDESPENSALQIIDVLFGVLQYSAKLENMTPEMRKMSEFWLGFMKEHKELLLNSPWRAYDPHQNYTWAESHNDNECAVAVYSIDKCVTPARRDTVYIANGCMGDRVLAELYGSYSVTVQSCYGEVISKSEIECNGITPIKVSVGGLITLKKA